MIDTRITVAGCGGTFWYEMAIIKKALNDAGINVEIIDNFPDDKITEEETARRMQQIASGELKNMKVTMIADHWPWGG